MNLSRTLSSARTGIGIICAIQFAGTPGVPAQPAPAAVSQMALWNFGPNAAGYSEAVTAHSLNATPTLVVAGALKDANGKDGVDHTDARGVLQSAGQSAAWDDTENSSAPAQVLLTLDTTGWQDLSLAFHYQSDAGEVDEYDLAWRSGTNGPWTTIADNAPLTADAAWHRLTRDLSAVAAIENAGAIQLLISDLDDDGNSNDRDNLRLDNVEITGRRLGGGPTIELLTTRVTDGPNVSGVVDDPTDPVANIGVSFAVAHPAVPMEALKVSAASSDPAVVPNDSSHLVIMRSGGGFNLRIVPAGRGYSVIRVDVSDGKAGAVAELFYAATSSGRTGSNGCFFGAGFSDASAAVALDANFMLVANDELGVNNHGVVTRPGPHIFLMDRHTSGRPWRAFDFTANLALPQPRREIDIEGATRSGDRVYWIAALDNNPDGECRPNRNRIFATDLSGSGTNTQLVFAGYYPFLRDDLIAWDANNWHKRGAHYYGFQAAAHCGPFGGRSPRSVDGFNVEGLAMAPDGTNVYIGFRAPLAPAVPGGKALIVPIKKIDAWFAGAKGQVSRRLTADDFGAPIELNLNGRSIRSIEANAVSEYLIVAGPAGGPETGLGFQLYRWSGWASDEVALLRDLPDPLASGAYEAIVSVPTFLKGSTVEILLDNGSSKWYRDHDGESKTLPGGHQRFAGERVVLP